jgi:nucleoside-diphosphate-sugar epimerase
VHLAFLITGNSSRQTTREINIDGTLNAFRAAADVGARRFLYASSVAAYGWHDDNPAMIDEDWPVRPAARLFYGQEKAQLESLLEHEAETHPGVALYLLRPPIVLGPNAVGAKDVLPGPLAPLGRRLFGRCSSSTRRTSAGRSSCASSGPGRPAPTTSPATAS